VADEDHFICLFTWTPAKHSNLPTPLHQTKDVVKMIVTVAVVDEGKAKCCAQFAFVVFITLYLHFK